MLSQLDDFEIQSMLNEMDYQVAKKMMNVLIKENPRKYKLMTFNVGCVYRHTQFSEQILNRLISPEEYTEMFIILLEESIFGELKVILKGSDVFHAADVRYKTITSMRVSHYMFYDFIIAEDKYHKIWMELVRQTIRDLKEEKTRIDQRMVNLNKQVKQINKKI